MGISVHPTACFQLFLKVTITPRGQATLYWVFYVFTSVYRVKLLPPIEVPMHTSYNYIIKRLQYIIMQ